jgi:hypothetical protein
MDTNLSHDDAAFRSDVRAFLAEYLGDELREAGRKRTSLWQDIDSAMTWQRLAGLTRGDGTSLHEDMRLRCRRAVAERRSRFNSCSVALN